MLRAREVSSRELTEACLVRIDRDAERLNTFLAVGRDRALSAADGSSMTISRAARESARRIAPVCGPDARRRPADIPPGSARPADSTRDA